MFHSSEYPFQFSINLYFTGTFDVGIDKNDKQIDDFKNQIKLVTTKGQVKNIKDLFQLFEIIPSFIRVQDGFTYYWFKDNRQPSWEANPDGSICEYVDEYQSSAIENNKKEWVNVKCKCEAKFQSLIIYWASCTDKIFSDNVFGFVIKVRRSRFSLQLWFDNNANEEIDKHIENIISKYFDVVSQSQGFTRGNAVNLTTDDLEEQTIIGTNRVKTYQMKDAQTEAISRRTSRSQSREQSSARSDDRSRSRSRQNNRNYDRRQSYSSQARQRDRFSRPENKPGRLADQK